MALFPLVMGAVAILASIVGALSVRTSTDNVEGALYKGLIVSGLLSAAAFYPITKWLMEAPLNLGVLDPGSALADASVTGLWLCGLIGIAVTAGLFVITDYYTSTRFRPVKAIAEASQTGHATNIIQGLAQGFQATALPAIVIALAVLGANELAGIYGIAVAVMAQLSLTGLIVALDAFGPITDNAGGIAEMAEMPEEVRAITDPLDAVGNTTKAVTKGYAIGSAVLAALVLFAAFRLELDEEAAADGKELLAGFFDIGDPSRADRSIDRRHDGLPVRRALDRGCRPCRGRGRRAGAQAVPRAPRESWTGPRSRTTATRSRIVTASAQREMILPSLIPIVIPLDRRRHQRQGARWPADRRHRGRLLHGSRHDRRRRCLGQRQEADRGRRLRRQGH